MENKRYFYMDLLRVIFTLSVLLYHLDLLTGGYLAVCCFFAMSGYLTVRSFENKESISLKGYYINRFKRLYLPLLTVVFVTIAIISLSDDIIWITLKPETKAILLGVDNFYQINANLDYFARSGDSPFIHLWYIAIQLQFDLLFPVAYILIDKIENKLGKKIKELLFSLIAIIFTIVFIRYYQNNELTITYYHTLSRVFSLFIGIAVFYNSFITKRISELSEFDNKYWMTLSLFVMCFLFKIVEASSSGLVISMIVVSVMTPLLLRISENMTTVSQGILYKVTDFINKHSYTIYLCQYPVIYFSTFLLNGTNNALVVIVLTMLASYIIDEGLNYKTSNKYKYAFISVVIGLSIFGGYSFYISEDHSEELMALQKQMAENQEMMLSHQQDYNQQIEEENQYWQQLLDSVEVDEEKIKEAVKKLPMVAVGDSVMLGASDELYRVFPNIYCDAKVSRTAWVVNSIFTNLKNRNRLSKTVIIHLGTNGGAPDDVYNTIFSTLKNCEVYLVSVTNDKKVHVNSNLKQYAKKYDNIHYIDWQQAAKGHKEYFVSDGIHLTAAGKKAYGKCIFEGIYNNYLEQINKQRDEVLSQYNDSQRKRIRLYGDDLLINSYNEIMTLLPQASFEFDGDTKEDLITKLHDDKENGLLAYNTFFVYDNLDLQLDDYQIIINEFNENKLHIVIKKDSSNLKGKLEEMGYIIIDFQSYLYNNPNYLLSDKIHLTSEGNKALASFIESVLQLEEQEPTIEQ